MFVLWQWVVEVGWCGGEDKESSVIIGLLPKTALKFHRSQMSANKICGCKRKLLVLWLSVMDVKLLLVFLTPLTGFLQLLVGSPQVFRAELRLQELEEELLSCWVLQSLLQTETPLLYSLLTGLFTGEKRGKIPVTHIGEACLEGIFVSGYLENDFKLLFNDLFSILCGRIGCH